MPIKTKPDFKAAIAKEIPQAGADFEKALKASESALADEKKNCDPQTIDNCLNAVKAVGAATDKAIKANKKDKDAVAFLKAYGPLVADEVKRLEEARKAAASAPADDEETSDEGVFEASHLGKCIKLLRIRELNFACGVHNKAEQSRIIFERKKSPKRLFQLLKGNKELDLPANRLTFGKACPSTDDKSTMVLSLDDKAEQPMGLIKKMRKLFKKRKEEYHPFRDVKLVVGGKVVEDIPDPQDTEPDDDDVQEKVHAAADDAKAKAPPQADQKRQQLLKKKAQVRDARQLWVQARDQARKNMAQVKAALRKAYRRDATQLPLVMQKASTLDAIFDDLSDDLRKSLDNYLKASPADAGESDRLESQVKTLVRGFKDRIDKDQLLAAIDEDQDLVPQLTIKAPLLEALRRLQDSLVA